MPAYMDLHVGDEIYTVPEVVVAIETEYETNRYGSGKHRTGRLIVTTRMLNVEQTRVVPGGSLVHTDGCIG
jgi:hypothetical protein